MDADDADSDAYSPLIAWDSASSKRLQTSEHRGDLISRALQDVASKFRCRCRLPYTRRSCGHRLTQPAYISPSPWLLCVQNLWPANFLLTSFLEATTRSSLQFIIDLLLCAKSHPHDLSLESSGLMQLGVRRSTIHESWISNPSMWQPPDDLMNELQF